MDMSILMLSLADELEKRFKVVKKKSQSFYLMNVTFLNISKYIRELHLKRLNAFTN